MSAGTVPFQNLAMSARSKGSVSMLSMLPSISRVLTTMPLGRIHDMVGVPVSLKPRRLQQLFSGRQAYLEEAAAGNATRRLRMQGEEERPISVNSGGFGGCTEVAEGVSRSGREERRGKEERAVS
jgi:hypothetical protein